MKNFLIQPHTTKGDLIKAIYTEAEQRNIDVALPLNWQSSLEDQSNVNSFWFVMDYNKNSIFGELTNLSAEARERNINLIKL